MSAELVSPKLGSNRIAVIGAGQLGARHLQGLARLPEHSEIFVVDPSNDALDLARKRFAEVPPSPSQHRVLYGTAIEAVLPEHLDLAIVATSSNVRLDVLRQLLADRTVESLLLEKVLFQQPAEYFEALDLLVAHGGSAWVNCSRRTLPIYHYVRDFFRGETIQYFQALGGEWGLGCNSIHLFDLLGLFTGHRPENLDTGGLDPDLISSKRPGFMEYTGSLRGDFGATAFELTSVRGSSARLSLSMRSASRSCVIDETAGVALFRSASSRSTWVQKDFVIPFVSQLSTTLVDHILAGRDCGLATLELSTSYHLPLITSLISHASQASGSTLDYCPVT